MLTGTYIGEDKELQGETAILRPSIRHAATAEKLEAQFDNLKKFSRHEHDYAFGWHVFNKSDFKVDEEIIW